MGDLSRTRFEKVIFEFDLTVKEPLNDDDIDFYVHQLIKDLKIDKENFEKIINNIFLEFLKKNHFVKKVNITVTPRHEEWDSSKVVWASSDVEFIIK